MNTLQPNVFMTAKTMLSTNKYRFCCPAIDHATFELNVSSVLHREFFFSLFTHQRLASFGEPSIIHWSSQQGHENMLCVRLAALEYAYWMATAEVNQATKK